MMAFVLNVNLDGYEYRGVRTGVGRESGKPWMSLILEDKEANQVDISVPQDIQGDVYSLALSRGDVISVPVRAVARADGNSYIQAVDLPRLIADKDGVLE